MTDGTANPTPPPLRRNFSFHLLWVCTFAAGVGDRLVMSAALPMLGYAGEDAENAGLQAGVQFFFFLPYLLWSPVAGWLADRLPRKWLLLVSDELRGVVVLAVFLILPVGVDRVEPGHEWLVWMVVLAVGMMAATFVPAKLSIVPNVVGLADLGRANAMVASMGIIGNLMGFLLFGKLLEHGSLRVALGTAAAAYMVSGLFWVFIKTPWKQKAAGLARTAGGGIGRVMRDITQGIGYARRHKPVRVLILTSAMVWTGVAVYMPALAHVNVEVYGLKVTDFTFLAAHLGIGMLVTSVLFGLFNPRYGAELIIAAGLAVTGFFIAMQMVVPSYSVGVFLALGTGLGAGLMLVPLNTMLQRATPDYLRGRVFAAREIVQEFGQVAVSFIIWRMAHPGPLMRPGSALLAGLLMVAAIYGVRRYATAGPAPSRLLNFLWRLTRLYCEAFHRLKVSGRHNIPHTGPVVMVSNHTAGLDPVIIQCAQSRLIRWMMAKEYMLGPLGWFWRRYNPIPVDRSSADPQAARAAIETLKAGGVIGLFPEGRINRDRRGVLPLGPGVTLLARRTDASFVPVYVEGTPRRSHALASLLAFSHSRVTFGKPFRLTPEQAADRDAALAIIREHMLEAGPKSS